MPSVAQHGHEAKREVDKASQSKTFEAIARLGLIGKGAIFILIGILAIRVAVGDKGQAEDKSGALETVARQPFGEAIVVALAVFFAAYAIWRFVEAIVGTDDDGAKDWAKRAGYVGRGAVYAVLAFVAIQIAAGADGENGGKGAGSGGGGNEDALTARVLDWPAGQWIVMLAGLAVLGAAGWNVWRGLSRKFKKTWHTEDMSEQEERVATGVGVAGHLARGVTFALIGAFIVRAAWQYDPKETVGLDGALAKLARADYGPWLLGLTALGLICYGLFCFAEARWREVEPDGASEPTDEDDAGHSRHAAAQA
jgi:hypothetical protein